MSAPIAADVVVSPPHGYTDTVEIGEALFDTLYQTPNGIPYRRDLGPNAGIARHAVSWAPIELPVYVETGRDARGGYLLLSTLLADPDGRSACWTEVVVTERGAALGARLDREVRRWAGNCSAVRTLGARRVVAQWLATRRDIGRALARLTAVGPIRYIKVSAESDGRMFGLPSFLPHEIDQPVLEAIADQCGLPRASLRRQAGGIISFRLLVTGAQESSADGRVNGCVIRAISNLPGYRKAP